jgi:hypothetical protein
VSSAVTATPLRDALAWIIDDAIAWREPQADTCSDCERAGGTCRDHESDAAIADAMHAMAAEVEAAGTDDEAIAGLRAFAPMVLEEIAKATTDEDVIAAITGGTDGGRQ